MRRGLFVVVGLIVGTVTDPGAFSKSSGLILERLRLNDEGKLQVDIVVRAEPPVRNMAEVEFDDSEQREKVAVVGLTAVDVRRIATTTKPLPCGPMRRITVSIVTPEDERGTRLHGVLRRRCDSGSIR